MKYNYLFLTFFMLTSFYFNSLKAQCAVNLGFEDGTFSNWVCKYGTYGTTGGSTVPVINLTPTKPVPTQHTITSGLDTDSNTNGAVTRVAPEGGMHSIKIGDEAGQLYMKQQYANAVGVSYTINPVTPQNAGLTYMYAVVVEEFLHFLDAPHVPPKFEVILTDNSTNPATRIPCGYYVVDGFEHKNLIQGKTNTTNGIWWYSKWTKVTLNLSSYIGKSISLEFRINDCASIMPFEKFGSGTHAAYAYIDMKCGASDFIKSPAICTNTKEISVCAPEGNTYKWEQLKKLTGVMGDSTTKNCITVNTPAVGEVYKVSYKSSTGCDLVLIDTLKGLQVSTLKNITLCPKQTPTYQLKADITSTNKITYNWSSIPAGFTSILQNPAISTPAQNTRYVIMVTDSLNGCSATDTLSIISSCELKIASNNATVCAGSCALLTATVIGIPPFNYKWQPDNLEQSAVTVCPTASTIYSLTVTDSLGAIASTTASVTANPLPDVNLTPFNVGIVTPASPSFDLTGGTPLGGIYSGKGVSAGKFYPASAGLGTHMITYSYTNNNGCKDSTSQAIVVSELSGIKNVFYNDALSVYPNPYTQSFTIETAITKAEHIRIELLNLLGEVVSTIEDATVAGTYKKQVNTANLPSGIYFLSVQKEGNLITKKVVKQ